MKQPFQQLGRTAVKELILWVSIITVITLILAGVSFYHYTTSSKLSSLMKQAELTADEIGEVLTIPLYNLDDEAAVNSAKVYMSNGRLFDIRLVSSATGVLIDTFGQNDSLVPPIQRNIFHNGMTLGSVTLLFADTEVRSAQQDTLMIVSFLICGIVVVYAVTLQLVFSRILIQPLGRIIEGIRRFADNDFGHRIGKVKYQDLNQLVLGLNSMAESIDTSHRKLLESQQMNTSILNSSFVGILLCKTDGSIIEANDTATTMFRAGSRQALLDRDNIHSLMAPERLGKSFDMLWERLAQPEVPGTSDSWQARHLDTADSFHVEIAVKPMSSPESGFLVVNILDITDRKEAEENLVQAQKMEAIGVLAGGLAHDFNNVLGGITGHISLLKFKLDNSSLDDDALRSSLQEIEHSAFKASSVINQLLTFSKAHSAELSIVDINKLVSNVLAIAEKSFDKSIEVKVSYHVDPALILGDAVQIEQVLLNLCVNAVHAMTIMRTPERPWGGQLTVSVKDVVADPFFRKQHPQAVDDLYWWIQVLDTGVGMTKQELSKIYVPFYSTKTSDQGTGLGLAMVFNIIKEHNGFINVYSEKSIGSSFNIFIPKNTDREQKTTFIPAVLNLSGKGVILLIDDNEAVRSTTKLLLTEFGFEVLTAENGADGIIIYREQSESIDLVMVDLVMPKLSGKETFLALKEINPDVKTILISGFGKDNRIQEMLDLGVDAFLQKPFTVTKLIDTLSTSASEIMS